MRAGTARLLRVRQIAGNPSGPGPQVVAEPNKIGRGAPADPAEIRPADDVGRNPGRRDHGCGEVNAHRDHVRYAEVHPERRACQRPVGADRWHAISGRQLDRLAAELVAAGRHPRATRGVGDDGDPVRGRRKCDLADDGRDMAQVRDEAAREPWIAECLTDHARLTMMHPGLCVEQVRDHACARIRGRRHLRGGRVTVPHAHAHARIGQQFDRGQGPVALRGERDEPERPAARGNEFTYCLRLRVDDPFWIVRAPPAK